MFVASGQIIYFLQSVAIGGVSGIVYSIFRGVNFLLKRLKPIKVVLTILFYVVLYLIFLQLTFLLKFPNVRAYMILGVAIGLALYNKSFHIILAKVGEKLYNRINRFILTKKGVGNDGKEIQKRSGGVHGRRSVVVNNTIIGNAIPNNKNKRRKEKIKRVGRTNCNI